MAPGTRVLVVSCGGTISSTSAGPAGGDAQPVAPRLEATDLVAALPELAPLGDIETRTFSTAPSCHLDLDDVLALHRLVTAWLDDAGERCGVVVTTGTDVLEELAWTLDLLWQSDVPLVVTGALRHPGLPGADGPANLLAATVTATSPGSRGCGVLVVLNDQIHLAGGVRKSHTSNVASFVSPNTGPIGWVSELAARVVVRPATRCTLGVTPASTADFPVVLLSTGLGDDGRLLDSVVATGYRGAVLAACGGGHLPLRLVASDGFERLLRSMPVVTASRCWSGELLRSTYDFAGSEIDLARRGVIGAGSLDGPRTRILLSLLLASGADHRAVEGAFARHGGASVEGPVRRPPGSSPVPVTYVR